MNFKPCKVCRRDFKVGDIMIPLTTVVAYKFGDDLGGTVGFVHLSCLAIDMPPPTKSEIRKGLRKV